MFDGGVGVFEGGVGVFGGGVGVFGGGVGVFGGGVECLMEGWSVWWRGGSGVPMKRNVFDEKISVQRCIKRRQLTFTILL